jgi:hypothetical protein
MIYCIGSRCRRVAVLNRKVSIQLKIGEPYGPVTLLRIVLAYASVWKISIIYKLIKLTYARGTLGIGCMRFKFKHGRHTVAYGCMYTAR